MFKKLFLQTILLAVSLTAVAAQERFVKPVDTASQNADFVAFRTQLIKALEDRNSAFIIGIVDPKIQLSFGGDAGLRDFKRIWKPERRDSPLWDELLTIMKNGGKFDKKEFHAPYLFTSWPEDIDAFEHSAIFGNDVNLRERPSTDARVIEKLSYNVVKIDFQKSIEKKGDKGSGAYDWLSVETLGGKKGFVKSEYVRSSIAYRAGFAKKAGKWKMTFLIAGD